MSCFFHLRADVFLAYAAKPVDSKIFNELLTKDSKLAQPQLILQYTPIFAQIAFIGALLVAFFPLLLGLHWKRATTQGTLAAIAAGFSTRVLLELFGTSNEVWLSQLVGFCTAGASMVAGSLLPQVAGHATPVHREAHAPHPHPASEQY